MKRALSLFLSVLMLFSVCVTPVMATDIISGSDSPVAEDIDVSAYAAIVLDMDTSEVLYEHDADEQNYPASTTKIMTAYLCLKYGDPNDEITVSSDAFNNLSQLASTGGLVVGETMKVYRLLQALLVVSASEAANVVGEYISGSHEAFVDLMNEEAQALGCTNTHFANCHGLPNSDHYTTARDLATIAMAAMEYDVFREIVGSAVTVMEATNVHKEQSITSTNGLLPGSYYPKYNYPYAIGIKTGHTSVAGYCLVSACNKDGKEIMCVVMGCGSREGSFAQSIKLYNWAYENYDILTWGSDAATEEAVAEAPEYEEVAASAIGEDPTVPVEEVTEESSEAPAADEPAVPDAEPVEAAASETAPAETVSANQTPESESEKTVADAFSAMASEAMLPALICFGIALALLLILLIVLVVLIVHRSNRRKQEKARKKRSTRK